MDQFNNELKRDSLSAEGKAPDLGVPDCGTGPFS